MSSDGRPQPALPRAERIAQTLIAHGPKWVWDAVAWLGVTFGVTAGGLLLEDFAPTGRRGWHISLAVVGLLLWVLGWQAHRWRSRNHGTLYYLRALAEGMTDYHAEVQQASEKQALDVRTVTTRLAIEQPFLDARAEVRFMREEFQPAINDDTSNTDYVLAPNLLWPVGIALGYDFMAPPDVVLREYEGRPGATTTGFDQPLPRTTAEWEAATRPGIVHIESVRSAMPGTARSVLISVQLTHNLVQGSSGAPWETPLAIDQWRERYDEVRIVGVPAPAGGFANVQVRDGGMASALAVAVADAVLAAARDHDRAVIVLSGRMAKCVAFSAGVALAARQHGLDAAEAGLWRRLVLYLWDERKRRMVPCWVRDLQGDPRALLVEAGVATPSELANEPRPMPASVGSSDPVQLVNLTPHGFRLFDAKEVVLDLPAADRWARVDERRSPASTLRTAQGDLPLVALSNGDSVEGLPAPQPGTVFVVSRLAAAAVPHRRDVVFPLDEVRDEAGQIVGCRSLGRFQVGHA